jgi:hypothetical protein
VTGTGSEPGTTDVRGPLLRVVRGSATPEELAALVAVVASRGSGTVEPEQPPVSHWATRASLLRRPVPHGPGAWQASGLPG